MKYQMDQSGKIEQTHINTVIAYSNSSQRAIVIPRKLKRKIQEVFRIHGFTEVFIYFLFAVGIFYLLSDLKVKIVVTIDTEYPGKNKIISSMLKKLFEESKKPIHEFHFSRIGNKPRAHYAAKDVFDRKKKANLILKLENIIESLKMTDGRLRECLSTLVDAQARSTIIVAKINKKIKR